MKFKKNEFEIKNATIICEQEARSMDKEEIDQQLLDSQFLENVETFVTDGY